MKWPNERRVSSHHARERMIGKPIEVNSIGHLRSSKRRLLDLATRGEALSQDVGVAPEVYQVRLAARRVESRDSRVAVARATRESAAPTVGGACFFLLDPYRRRMYPLFI